MIDSQKLTVTNTLTGKKEKFISKKSDEVSMYVCGMTVQDYPHLGHARCYITFDVIKRYLQHLGYKVNHVQNYTDIDDKIIAKANEESLSVKEVAEKYKAAYEKDMSQLGILPADKYPLATEHITEIIKMIKGLIDKGYAYQINGDVYFYIDKFSEYGKLSKRTLDEMRAGERVEVDTRKKDPMDFALWKSSKPGEPSWDSPWGKGRPGWHIECSAMSLKYLGSSFDIHGGGQDLIFPHHENEIAQSEAFTGEKPFVRYWLHNGFVNLSGEKMSKSTGNFVYLNELLERFPAPVIRLFVVSAHYRSPIDFTQEGLEAARSSLEGILATIREAYEIDTNTGQASNQHSSRSQKFADDLKNLENRFEEAMLDDFNTAAALAEIYEIKDRTNLFIKESKGVFSKTETEQIKHGRTVLINLLSVFGINANAKSWLIKEHPPEIMADKREIDDLLNNLAKIADTDFFERDNGEKIIVEKLVRVRQALRKNKNWVLSDYVRDRLKEKNLIIEDVLNGTRIFISPW